MAVVFKNNAKTTLASNLSSSATSIVVADGSVFPTLGSGETFFCTLDNGTNNEIVKVTAVSSNTLTVIRAQESTTARAFSTGDAAESRLTAGILNLFSQTGVAITDEIVSYLNTNGISLPDNVKAQFGASNDLQIYHSGSYSYIKELGTNGLYIDTNGDGIYLRGTTGNKNMVRAIKDGAVTLYHNGDIKAATTSTGIAVTGAITSSGNITSGNDVFVPNGRYFRFTGASSSSSGGFLFGDSSGTGGYIAFRRNSDSASVLTLNANQNATFAGTVDTGGKITISNSAYNNHLRIVRSGQGDLNLSPSGNQLLLGGGGFSPASNNAFDLGRTDKYWQDLWLGSSLKMNGQTILDASRNLSNIGTISSGAITSSGAVSATEYDLPSGGMLDWANGDARIIEGLVNNYSLSFQTYDGSNATTALRLDGNNAATFGGTITATGKIKTTSGELEFTSNNHKLTTNNANNVLLKSGGGGAMGLLGQDSGSNFKWQLYGDGTAYGFLNAAWNSWNLRKVISGALYLNNDTTYYIQPESTSNLNNVQAQSYKIGTTTVIDASRVLQNVTTATASAGTNTTALANTAFVQQEITSLIGGAPGTLNTLNELAAAINDDSNYNSTLTTALATKLPSASYTAADVLTKVKTVDGASSGLDADLLDGQQGSYYQNAGNLNAGNLANARMSSAYLATRLGEDAHSLTTLNSTTLWSQPSGYQTMVKASTSSGLPSSHGQSYFGYNITSRRDTGTGYSALLTTYDNSNMWFTYNSTEASYPTWRKLWHDGNDGSGSGLDADTLDGQHASSFLTGNQTITLSGHAVGSGTTSIPVTVEYVDSKLDANNVNLNNPPNLPASGSRGVVGFYNAYFPTGSGNISNYNAPLDSGQHYHIQQFNGYSSTDASWSYQIAHNFYNQGMFHRNQYNGTWQAWRKSWDSLNDGSGSGLDADLLDGVQLSGIARLNYDNTNEIRATNFKANAGGVYYAYTAAGNLRGYMYATDTNDEHLVLRTSGGEDIAFKDDTTNNMIVRGDGNVWIRGAIVNGTIPYSQVTGTPTIPTNNNQLTNGAGYITASGNAATSHAVTGSAFATTGSPGSVLEYQQAASITDTKLAPSGDWHNTIRMGHGNPYSYYSNTLAMQMTGTGTGRIRTQTISNNTALGWREVWDSGNDGSGSGLDADLLDGNQASAFATSAQGTLATNALPKAGGTMTGTLTSRDIMIGSGYTLQRSTHQSGHFEGGHNNLGNTSGKTSPIYTIGSSYNPAETTLSNMYGIGFSHINASFINVTGGSGWGMYVASDGDARIFLDAENGTVHTTGAYRVGSNIVWHAGNDGSGSGLDADTVDGLQASQFIRSDAAQNNYSHIINLRAGGNHLGNHEFAASSTGTSYSTAAIELRESNYTGTANATPPQIGFHWGGVVASNISIDSAGAILIRNNPGNAYENFRANNIYANGTNLVWHVGNDGAGSGLDADLLDGQQGSYYAPASGANYVPSGGGWMGSNFSGSRHSGLGVNGGEIAFIRDHPNSGQMSVLVDGAFFAGENNGFYSLWSGNSYNNKVGFYGDTSGDLQFNSAGTQAKFTTAHGYIQLGPMNTSHAHIYTDRTNFYFNRTLLYALGNLMWHAGNDGSGSGLDADLLDGQQGSYYNQSQFTGSDFTSRNSGNAIAIDSVTTNMVGYVNTSTAAGFSDGAGFSAAYSSSWVGQLFVDFRTGKLSTRGKNNGTWQAHRFMWDNLNDGSGSGLDADLLDGIGGDGYLRSNANDAYDGILTMNGMQFRQSNVVRNLKIQASTGGSDVGISGFRADGGHGFQVYGDGSNYGFLDGNWASWDLKKAKNGQLHVDEGSGLVKVWSAGNDGSGSGLDADLLDGQQGSYYAPATGGNYEPVNATILHQGSDLSSADWNTFIDGTEASWNTVLNHSGSNRPVGYYTYGTALSFSKSGQAKFQLYASEQASAGNGGLAYRTGWNTSYRAWVTLWDSGNDGSGSGLDADLLDGIDSASFLRGDTADTISNNVVITQKGEFTTGTSGQNNTGQGAAYNYGYQQPGAWSHPYPDIVFGYHTGMRFGGHTSYGGCRFYADHPFASTSILFSVGNGDTHVRATNNIYAYTSDRRLKENFRPIENAVDKVKAIGGFIFDWRKDMMEKHDFTPDQQQDDAGLIAQEVQKVMPAAIKRAPFDHDLTKPNQSKSGEEFLTVQYEKMVPLLVEAIKEQQKQIDELKEKLENK